MAPYCSRREVILVPGKTSGDSSRPGGNTPAWMRDHGLEPVTTSITPEGFPSPNLFEACWTL